MLFPQPEPTLPPLSPPTVFLKRNTLKQSLIISTSTDRTIRHIRLPRRRNLRIRRQIAVRRKTDGQILLHTGRSRARIPQLLQKHDYGTGKVVEEDEIDDCCVADGSGEGDVGLEVVGLRVEGNLRVDCVVAVGAKVVGCGVAGCCCGCGLTAEDAAAGVCWCGGIC